MGDADATRSGRWRAAAGRLLLSAPAALIVSISMALALYAMDGAATGPILRGTEWWKSALWLGAVGGMAQGWYLTWGLIRQTAVRTGPLLLASGAALAVVEASACRAVVFFNGEGGSAVVVLLLAMFLSAALTATGRLVHCVGSIALGPASL